MITCKWELGGRSISCYVKWEFQLILSILKFSPLEVKLHLYYNCIRFPGCDKVDFIKLGGDY